MLQKVQRAEILKVSETCPSSSATHMARAIEKLEKKMHGKRMHYIYKILSSPNSPIQRTLQENVRHGRKYKTLAGTLWSDRPLQNDFFCTAPWSVLHSLTKRLKIFLKSHGMVSQFHKYSMLTLCQNLWTEKNLERLKDSIFHLSLQNKQSKF